MLSRKALIFITWVALLFTQAFSQSDSATPKRDSLATAEKTAGALPAADAGPTFRPGDAVRIYAYPDTMLFMNGTYVIDKNGCIMLPFDGPVSITHFTEDGLAAYLTDRYVKYLPYPKIHVRRLMRLSFLGGFQRPGMYYVDPAQSLWNAMLLAGVPLREDGMRLLRLERGGQIIDKKVGLAVEKGIAVEDAGIVSGDQIWVTVRPRRRFGEVFQAEVFPWISLTTTLLSIGITAYQLNLLREQTTR